MDENKYGDRQNEFGTNTGGHILNTNRVYPTGKTNWALANVLSLFLESTITTKSILYRKESYTVINS